MKNICDFLYAPNTEKCFRRKIFSRKITSLKLFYNETILHRNKRSINDYSITYTAIKQVQISNPLHCQNTESFFNRRYIHSATKGEQPSSRI